MGQKKEGCNNMNGTAYDYLLNEHLNEKPEDNIDPELLEKETGEDSELKEKLEVPF